MVLLLVYILLDIKYNLFKIVSVLDNMNSFQEWQRQPDNIKSQTPFINVVRIMVQSASMNDNLSKPFSDTNDDDIFDLLNGLAILYCKAKGYEPHDNYLLYSDLRNKFQNQLLLIDAHYEVSPNGGTIRTDLSVCKRCQKPKPHP